VDVKKRLSPGNKEGTIVVHMAKDSWEDTLVKSWEFLVGQDGEMLETSACNVGDVSSCICHTSGHPQSVRGARRATPSCMKVSTRKGECEEIGETLAT
jgi:hypothetical protein